MPSHHSASVSLPACTSRRAFGAALCALGLVAATLPAAAAPPAPKVLLIVSSEGRDAGKTRPGFDMEEFAKAWVTLRANGLAVEVASPAGGAPEPDRFDADDEAVVRMKADPAAAAALAATRRTAEVRAGEHAALFVLGGKGAMFDLPRDAALQRLLLAHADGGGVLAAVCHGPAALVAMKRADGSPWLAGRRITGFTDEEEATFGKRWASEFPFLLESRARELGALWQEAPLMMPKWVVDGRLITGQNPFSTVQVAEAVVQALGRKPVATVPFRDDASMALVERWLAGEQAAVRTALRERTAHYKPELIAMLGYYQFKAATDADARRRALSLMELGEPHMPHPRLRTAMAEAHIALGNPAAARELLGRVLAAPAKDAEREAAVRLLQSLPS
jgi:putative intracellular protease/amidase